MTCFSPLLVHQDYSQSKKHQGKNGEVALMPLLNLSQPPFSANSNPVVARCNQIIPQREYTFVLSYLSFFLSSFLPSVEYKNQRIPSITPIDFLRLQFLLWPSMDVLCTSHNRQVIVYHLTHLVESASSCSRHTDALYLNASCRGLADSHGAVDN